MNVWLLAACVVLSGGLSPCVWASWRGTASQRLVAISLAGTIACAVFLLTAQGVRRTSYNDLAFVLAVLAPAGTLVFARFVVGEGQLPVPDGEDSGSREG